MSLLDKNVQWRVYRRPRVEMAKSILHLLAIWLLYYSTVPSSHHKWFWLAAVVYYWFFYWRMIRFGIWTSETLDVIAVASAGSHRNRLCGLGPTQSWPEFIILVPAYSAGPCIRTVATILNGQDYPRERWKALFISDEPEYTSAIERANSIAQEIHQSIRIAAAPKTISVAEAALILCLADDNRRNPVEYARLFGLSQRQIVKTWAALLARLALRGHSTTSEIPTSARALLSAFSKETNRRNKTALNDIADMVAIDQRELDCDAAEQIWAGIPSGFGRSLEAALREYANGSPDEKLRMRLLDETFLGSMAAVYSKISPCSSQAIDTALARLGSPNLVHYRRPPGTRNKAAALNYGFEVAVGNGWVNDNSFIMVLDSDSFLPTSALSLSALEILGDLEPNVIRQLLPITTTNFNGRNWFVRTIIASDSMAAPGRWAVNVRMQTRADLTAGSGVVIPATLLHYLRRVYGKAWDSEIICEDARMIMSQYAILDGVTKRTKMVPSYVLEGAPERENAWQTYLAFWRQRVRWALGGMDEVCALLRVPVAQMLVSSRDFGPLDDSGRRKCVAYLRKVRLILCWLKEHLWWSATAFAPVLWIAAEFVCGAPRWPVRVAGCLLVVAVPASLLLFLFRPRVARLVPGGVSRLRMWELLVQLIVAALPFVLPVLVAQLVCVAGQRKRFSKWNPPTPKPGSQFAMG